MQDLPYKLFLLLKSYVTPIVNWVISNINSIAANIFSTIIYVLFAAGILILIKYASKNRLPLKKIISFRGNGSDLYICYAMITTKSNNRSVFLLEEGDVTALYNLVDVLSDVYGRNKLIILNHQDIQQKLAHIPYFVSISGPLHNKVTEQYIGISGSPLTFSRNKKSIVLKNNNTEKYFETTYNNAGVVKSCHGIIVCSSYITPIGINQKFIICAGNSSVSTYTAIIILQRIGKDKKLLKKLSKEGLCTNNSWAILFKVDNWSDAEVWSTSSPIKDSSLRYEIIKIVKSGEFLESYEYHYK